MRVILPTRRKSFPSIKSNPLGLLLVFMAGSFWTVPSQADEFILADCGTSQSVPLITTDFNIGTSGLVYQDDALLNTAQPNYASGNWGNSVGRSGGGLRVFLGGVNGNDITNMSGGWSYSFSLATAAEVSVSFWYNLVQAANYETDEYSEAYYALDGNETFLFRITGDNNGGSARSSGWQQVNVNLGQLPAGTHTFVMGAFNNKKTFDDESTELFLDDFQMTSTTGGSGGSVIDSEGFESGWGNWVDGGGDAARYSSAGFANTGNFSAQLRDNSGSSSSIWIDLDLSAYTEITVDFSYIANSFDSSNEDFFLQVSTNGGGSFATIEEWNLGDEFQNGQRENESITIQGPFTANTRIRFLCDATANGDQVYLDDIVIKGCELDPDNEAPSDPQNLVASNISTNGVSLAWDASTDNQAVVGYYIYQNGSPIPVATATTTSALIAGLDAETSYQFSVAAFDARGNVSGQSQAIQVTTDGECPRITLYKEDFENGVGFWQVEPPARAFTPGSFISTSGTGNYSGTYSMAFQGDRINSWFTSRSLDFSAYPEIQVDFTARVFEYYNNRDGFMLQVSTDGGNSFTTVEQWRIGAGTLVELERIFEKVTIPGPFSAETQIRFSAIINNTRGYGPAYFDDIAISVCALDGCTEKSNIALDRPARLSTTYGAGVAGLGVDGNTTGSSPWTADLVHTSNEAQPWWEVDLGVNSQVDSVRIFNRTDCCQERLKDFFILVSDSPMEGDLNSLLNAPNVNSIYYPYTAGPVTTLPINSQGRYVRLQLEGSGTLHFAEMEVIGCNLERLCIPPTVSINPVGALAEDSGIFQLDANPIGGTWSGSINPDGSFDPSQGEGTYEVIYAYEEFAGCSASDTLSIQVLPAGSICTTPENLSLNQATSQSSTYGVGAASVAVDGNTTGISAWTPDLQHTTNETQPWWQVELAQKSQLSEMVIYNRSDVLQERLKNFYILVSDLPMGSTATLNDLLANPAVTATYFPGAAGQVENIPLSGEGRYVRIHLTGSGILHMAEVMVMGCPIAGACNDPVVSIDAAGPFPADAGVQQLVGNPFGGSWSGAISPDGNFDPSQGPGTFEVIYTYTDPNGCSASAISSVEVLPAGGGCSALSNLALGKAADQSSTYGAGLATLATDGNSQGSSPWTADLQHTLNEAQPWWQVDLGVVASVQQVKIYNRTDCCFDRLKDFYILSSLSPFDPAASLDDLLADGNVSSYYVAGGASLENAYTFVAEGRYVRIQLTGSNTLHMAEVEVIGCVSANDPCFGEISASIDPVSDQSIGFGSYQLGASPAGGVWSGDVTASGLLEGTDCPGVFEAIYTYDNGQGCVSTDTTWITVQPDTMAVFIYAGQSNATGVRLASDNLATGSNPFDGKIAYAWNVPGVNVAAMWDTLQPIAVDSIRLGHGAEISFGRTLYEKGYNNLGIIKVAKGGTSLNNSWDPTSTLGAYDANTNEGMYPEMLSYVNARLADLDAQGIPYRITGFLWHQGEGDMNPNMADKYQSNLTEFISILRNEFGSGLKVFVASVYNPNATVEEGETVRRSQRNVAAADPHTYVVNLDSVYYTVPPTVNLQYVNNDSLHYNSLGLVKVGESFANSFTTFNPIPGCGDNQGGICPNPDNLALGQPTAQSSTYGNGSSGIAVDGNISGSSPWTPDLAHTNVEFQPWWEVDLGSVSNIEQVKIYNRNDCCFGRLNNFYVLVSDQPFDPTDSLTQLLNDPMVTAFNFPGSAGLIETIDIGIPGRYVRIQHTREIQMHIAEVEVYGCTIESQSSRFAGANEELEGTAGYTLRVFPNPTHQLLNLEVPQADSDEIIEYSLYNLTGQRVWTRVGGNQELVNVKDFAKGVYFIHVKGDSWKKVEQVVVN